MELAVHMKHRETGEKRIWRTTGENSSTGWHCKDFFYGSCWAWEGTEPWHNVAADVTHIGRGYYRMKEKEEAAATTNRRIVEGYDIWKTSHNGQAYWLLLVCFTDGSTEMKHFDTKIQAVNYFLDCYGPKKS